MLSNKWTFSLTYLVMLVAIGFAMGLMVTPDAGAADVLGDKFATTLTLVDVSFETGNQLETGALAVNVEFGKEVKYTTETTAAQ